MMNNTYNPVSTYRLQFNQSFTFGDAEKIVTYLRKSGVRTIYASPVFQAAPRSDHGYDVTDPHRLNEQIGNEKAHGKLLDKLKSAGMGWIQDVVPNHMAYSAENPWIFDLLRKGPDSAYYSYFDLIPSEQNPDLNGKMLLPFLGSTLEDAIKNKELSLRFGEQGFLLSYFEAQFPVSELSWEWILEKAPGEVSGVSAEIRNILESTKEKLDARTLQFHSLYLADQDFKDHLDACVTIINGDPEKMHHLVTLQHYLPVHWQETEKRISYRRFFSINGLICLNIQHTEVFMDVHRLISKWVGESKIQGLRIDHIDGLYDPAGYLENVRNLYGDDLYLVVEKILEEDELLPGEWPVQGTTGYDFLALVNNLLTNVTSEDDFRDYLGEWRDQPADYATLAIRKKKYFLEHRFRGELEHLLQECRSLSAPAIENLSDAALRQAIAGFLLHCPVYRIYGVPSRFSTTETKLVRKIFSDARKADPDHHKGLSALEALFCHQQTATNGQATQAAGQATETTGKVTETAGKGTETAGQGTETAGQDGGTAAQSTEAARQSAETAGQGTGAARQGAEATGQGTEATDQDGGTAGQGTKAKGQGTGSAGQETDATEAAENTVSQEIDNFFRRCMQFTGPLMAKGIEDTLFYSYHPFLAHNEVGDSPGFFGIRKDKFHAAMQYRRKHWPMAMNTTSTHDTKRGEDARARLNVLSDIPKRWIEITQHWHEINRSSGSSIDNMPVPSRNDAYFIYQSLVAHVPMDGAIDESFTERFKAFMIKALREAKMNTSWSDPQEAYESGTLAFIESILTLENDFLGSLYQFVGEIKVYGMINSLVQLTLKHTVPGVPDTFQGNETWNLDFVDPDNRKPVDYNSLSRNLNKLLKESKKDKKKLLHKLWSAPENGNIKQWVHHLLLQERDQHTSLYLKGDYTPLKKKGAAKNHVIAFQRHYKDEYLLVILPLNLAAMNDPGTWKKTRVELPELAPLHWENLFTGKENEYADAIHVQDLFKDFPVAVLKGVRKTADRKSGILMHISSLPGDFGIGDFGPGATQFIDFLHRTGQRYWQILPLSVTEKSTAHSPYSSASAFAGNALFIDPYRMVRDGILNESSLKNRKRKVQNRVKYKSAAKAKNTFIREAFHKFKTEDNRQLNIQYQAFLEKERYWLEDYALFTCLRDQFNNQPWNNWPDEYRDRDPKTLETFSTLYDEQLEFIRFTQFLFSQQWKETRHYANDKGIEIYGDIPIYVDFNSADVWAHQELFKLDAQREMSSVAGVPPDYFNKEGQHWGMPLFDWKVMEKDGFRWWLKRLEKNLEWFDLLRLDHFRGFSAYWDIPAAAESAIHGKWEPGPGEKLFKAIKKKFPHMPFVAEDLGMIDQDVYDLRDQFELPGMKVVQFGFGKNMPESEHNPLNINYNSIVYTGTHDNNTLKGWYKQELDKKTLKRIRNFNGVKLNGRNVHLEMIRIAYATQAKLVIVPMQDWLGLNEKSRMNFPSTTSGNWKWKLPELPEVDQLEKKIIDFGKTFGRF